MRLSMRWLQEYVSVPWSVDELAERLTLTGIKVDGIERAPLGGLEGVIVGQVVTCGPHPTRQGLLVCQVALGAETASIVTGAPNVEAGARVPVALPGGWLPGRDQPVGEVPVGGVLSRGMLCSEAELGLGGDESGVWLLPPDTPIGEPLVRALGLDDAVLTIDVYPNRADCLSVVGLAREVAALTGSSLQLPRPRLAEAGRPATERYRVRVAAKELCPRYMGRVIDGVQVGPSPRWLQERLRAGGMRPINNVVDVTNFVMLELGQPLHAFDAALIGGAQLIVRRAKAGESIVTLDGVERQLEPDMLVIADAAHPVAIAGVMGSAGSEVSEATRTIFLESAVFDPVVVRRAARRLGLRSEASLRFEKGIDLHRCAWAIERAAALLAELTGGAVAPGVIDERAGALPGVRRIVVRPRRVNAVLGTSLSAAEMKRLLRNLQFGVEIVGEGQLEVEAPVYRRDIERETDLIEEIARLFGYDRIPATLPTGTAVIGGEAYPLPWLRRLRERLLGAGLSEAITSGLIDPDGLDRLGLPADEPRRQAIPLRNPLARNMSVLRPLLAVGLLDALAVNAARHNPAAHLFEIGAVFRGEMPLAGLPEEPLHLGLALFGPPEAHWRDRPSAPDFFDLKGYVELACEALEAPAHRFQAALEPFLHPGRAARLIVGDLDAGFMGELHPRLAEAWGLPGRPLLAEIDLGTLLREHPPERAYELLPRFPAVSRDIALLVPANAPAAAVAAVIERYGKPLVRRVLLFDVYSGEQVPAGQKSLAYSIQYQAAEGTLTDAEVEAQEAAILAGLAAELGVRRR